MTKYYDVSILIIDLCDWFPIQYKNFNLFSLFLVVNKNVTK